MIANRMPTKATLILGALLSTGLVAAQAQAANQAPPANAPQGEHGRPGNFHRNFDPARQAAHLGRRLGLSDQQVAAIKPILAGRAEQMQKLRADASLSGQERHAKFHALAEDTNSRIVALLNDTQKQKFQQMMAERRTHQRGEHERGERNHRAPDPAAAQPQA